MNPRAITCCASLALSLSTLACEAPGRQLRVEEGMRQVNGVELFYKTVGEGEPIVVLHGGPGFDHHHMSQLGVLGHEYRVIFYDQRATGNSTGTTDSSSITVDNFVEDLEGLRQAFGLEQMNLLGASWGGMLAMQYGMKYPDRLRSLILLGPAPPRGELVQVFAENMRENTSPEDGALLAQLRESAAFMNKEPGAMVEYYRVLMRAYVYDRRLADSIDMTLGENTARNHDAVNSQLWRDLGSWDIRDRLSAIMCPTLIVHGVADPLPLVGSYEIHLAISRSKFVVLERAGHWLHVEALERVRAAVLGFLTDPESFQSDVPVEIMAELEGSI